MAMNATVGGSKKAVVPFHGEHRPVDVYQVDKSRNLIPQPLMTATYTSNGVTFEPQDDGSVYVHGTATAQADSPVVRFDVPAGKYFVKSSLTNGTLYFVYKLPNGSTRWGTGAIDIDVEQTGTYVYMSVPAGITIDGYAWPMMNEGSEPLPYEPYGTVKRTIYEPSAASASGTSCEFEGTYSHEAEVAVMGRSTQETLTGKNLCTINEFAFRNVSGYAYTRSTPVKIDIEGIKANDILRISLVAKLENVVFSNDTYPDVDGRIGLFAAFTYMNTGGNNITTYIDCRNLYRNWGVSNSETVVLSISYTVPSDFVSLVSLEYDSNKGSVIQARQMKSGTVEFSQIIVTVNSPVEPYEPYCGGIPAPNPDYPMPIVSVTEPVVGSRGRNGENATRAIDLQGHELRSLPDGTRDEVRVRRDGSVELLQIGYLFRSTIGAMDNNEVYPGWVVYDGSLNEAIPSANKLVNCFCNIGYISESAKIICVNTGSHTSTTGCIF